MVFIGIMVLLDAVGTFVNLIYTNELYRRFEDFEADMSMVLFDDEDGGK